MRKTLIVVAAVIKRVDKILIARRGERSSMAGYWEFPGGKIEAGESPEQALERELWEELSLRTKTQGFLARHRYPYPDFDIDLAAYYSLLLGGEPTLKEHSEIQWVLASELKNFAMAPADLPFLPLIERDSVRDEKALIQKPEKP